MMSIPNVECQNFEKFHEIDEEYCDHFLRFHWHSDSCRSGKIRKPEIPALPLFHKDQVLIWKKLENYPHLMYFCHF